MQKNLIHIIRLFLCQVPVILLVFSFGTSNAEQLTDEASRLFNRSKESVFQIRVIDLSTGEKSSAGSGFYISKEGHLATNYHVVSDYVFKPQNYRITFIKNDGSSHDLKLIDIDVIHDLAILKSKDKVKAHLSLGASEMPKGERIFSMGNPHDLGMSIIEGNFNGIMERSMYRKILFSGSLNSGMSGGPAFNHKGEVIGINVSTKGNDISFLIPVEFLKELFEDVQKYPQGRKVVDWFPLIENQLVMNQKKYIDQLMASDWDKTKLDKLMVPGEISKNMKCWGKTYDTEKSKMLKVRSKCRSVDWLYLSRDMYTFYFSYWFTHHKNKKINTFQLYNHLEDDFDGAFSFGNSDTDEYTKFQCNNNFVQVANRSFKAAFCVRQYKQFKQLYDVNLILSSVDEFDEAVVGELVAMGLTKKRISELTKRFLGEINWQK